MKKTLLNLLIVFTFSASAPAQDAALPKGSVASCVGSYENDVNDLEKKYHAAVERLKKQLIAEEKSSATSLI